MKQLSKFRNLVTIVTIPHEDPVIRIFMLFTQLAGVTMKYIDSQFYRAHHLSMIKYMTLKILSVNGGIMKHSELARWTNTKKHNITTLIERMKQQRLVTTERSQKDKRIINIIITDKGRKLYEQTNNDANKLVKRLMAGMDESTVLEFEKLLIIIKGNLENN